MKKVLTTTFDYLRSFVILCLFWIFGAYLHSIGIPLPDAIIGLLLLFLSLLFKVIPEYWVAPACTLLGRYMALLFVPVSVGLMVNYQAVQTALLPLIVACIASSLLILLLVAYLIEWQERRSQMRPLKKKNAFKKEHKNV